ncbi:MAG: VOC family protein [Pseudomonadota bacterium]
MSSTDCKPQLTPFHLAIQVRNIAEARQFYGDLLGCSEGRSDAHWVDFDLFGHQLVVHLNPGLGKTGTVEQLINPVDEHAVPVPHFGVVLTMDDWALLAERLGQKVQFIIEPSIRFRGEVGEQGTMFFCDPSGNALEFKGFRNIESELFAIKQ